MGTRIIAASVMLALLMPGITEALRPFLGVCVVTMLIVSLLRVDYGAFLGRLKQPVRAVSGAVWITVLIPVLALGTATLAGADAAIILVVLFLFCSPPPIVSAPAFAMLMGLDGALVLAVMLLATIAMPITASLTAAAFVPDLPLDAVSLALRLAGMIAVAFVVATVLRRWFGAQRIADAKPAFDTISVVIAVVFALGAMDGVGAALVSDPGFTLLAALGAFLFMLGQIALTYALFRPLVGADAVAIGYAAGNRNAGLFVAALGLTDIDPTVWLFFALSQVPIFLFPLILQPIGRRLSARSAAAPGVSP